MSMLPHTKWFKKTSVTLSSSDGKPIDVYEFNIDHSDTASLKSWSKHFREHYCLDSKIDRYRQAEKMSRREYLLSMVFPSKNDDFGPATRSGDFAEILFADMLQSLFGYYVPRTRYFLKMIPNESSKGTDVLGFKFKTGGNLPESLIAVESKAQFSGKKADTKLQEAVIHSNKDLDKFRIAKSLNSMKQRLDFLNDDDGFFKIEQFQDPLEKPYDIQSGATALFCSSLFDAAHIASTTSCANHSNRDNLTLIVMHAVDLRKIVHEMYERAANDA